MDDLDSSLFVVIFDPSHSRHRSFNSIEHNRVEKDITKSYSDPAENQ